MIARGVTMFELALAHAGHGRPVAIICPPDDGGACRYPKCGKWHDQQLAPHDRKEVGKAPIGRLMPNGINNATTNTAIIERWWHGQPDGNVGIDLWAAGLMVVDTDSPETEAAALSNGLDGGLIRDSRNRAYVFKRPPDCPQVNLIKADGDPLDILTFGNFLVGGRHQTGCPIYMDPDAEPGPAPLWPVEMLRRKADEDAAQAEATRARRAERAEQYGSGTEPPVRLQGDALRRWRGELFQAKPNGDVDRSDSLFYIGLELAEAGATEGAIVAALEERDETLGWRKYSGRRDDREYVKIAEKVVAHATAPNFTFDAEFRPETNDSVDDQFRPAKAPEARTLPEISISNRHSRDVTQDAVAALVAANQPPVLYVYRGQIARVRLDEQGRPIVETLSSKTPGPLRGMMDRSANYVRLRETDGGLKAKPVAPPVDIVADVLGLASWPFPPLRGVIESPGLRQDGTIITRPGYDQATGLLYIPARGLVVPMIPDRPSPEQMAEAVRLIEDVIGEFPYADQPSRANAFAMLITPVVRPAISGNVPLGLINKPRAGAGASLLVETFGRIAAGRPATAITAPKTEEEFRKTLTAALAENPTGIMSIDNLEATLVSAALAAALTGVASGRTLGSTAMTHVDVRWTPYATGNNVRLGGDLPRRVYECRLDPQVSRPWTRTGFRHDDLPGWVMTHRGELIAAVLTIARGYYAAGKPKADVPKVGGFDEWAQTVGGMLAYAGVDGFLGNLAELWETNDEEGNEWEVYSGPQKLDRQIR